MRSRAKLNAPTESAEPEVPPRSRRQRGRPMSEGVERRLLDAALTVLTEHGIGALSVDKIAEVAGVPRTTFYRRWQTANEAVGTAIKADLAAANPGDPATGDVRKDLTILGKNMVRLLNTDRFARVISFVIAEMAFNPGFRTTIMEIMRHRRQYTAAVLARGQEADQVSRELDPELLVEMFAGPMFFRLIFGETPPDGAYVTKLLDVIIGGRGVGKAASKAADARRPPTASKNTRR